MMYVSKGMLVHTGKDGFTHVAHCGRIYALGPVMTDLWMQGRRKPQTAPASKEKAVRRLAASGLTSITDESDELGTYRLLVGCILCPEKKRITDPFLSARTRRIWRWLREAGLHLTVSELVRLEERQLNPETEYLGAFGRQQLTEILYTPETICEGMLDIAMEHSHARNTTVASLLELLRSGRLLLI